MSQWCGIVRLGFKFSIATALYCIFEQTLHIRRIMHCLQTSSSLSSSHTFFLVSTKERRSIYCQQMVRSSCGEGAVEKSALINGNPHHNHHMPSLNWCCYCSFLFTPSRRDRDELGVSCIVTFQLFLYCQWSFLLFINLVVGWNTTFTLASFAFQLRVIHRCNQSIQSFAMHPVTQTVSAEIPKLDSEQL